MSYFLEKETQKKKNPTKTSNQNTNPKPAASVNTWMNVANTLIPTDEYLSHSEMKNSHFSKYTAQ